MSTNTRYDGVTTAANTMDDEVIAHAMRILEARMRKPEARFHSPNCVKDYLRLHYRNHGHEEFNVLFLASDNSLIANECMFRGTINQVNVHIREVAKTALKHNAAAIILAHNHPSAASRPSKPDRDVTLVMKRALAFFDIPVLDHMVVGCSDVHSFVEHNEMP